MRVKSCEASDNQNRPIQLSDSDGCVLRPKMVSKFMKMRSTDPRATVVTYAFFHAFKFPDSMAVHIKCKVEICRYGCPDHCQSPAAYVVREQEVSNNYQQSGNRRVYQNPQPQVQPQPAYNPDPRTPLGSIYAPQPPPLPLPAALIGKEPRLARENSEIDSQEDTVGSAKNADAGLGDFLGLKLPELPKFPSLPSLFGGDKPKAQSKKDGQAIPLSLGIKPDLDVSENCS